MADKPEKSPEALSIDHSAVLALLTYVIASYSDIAVKSDCINDFINELDKKAPLSKDNSLYVDNIKAAIKNEKTLGEIKILAVGKSGENKSPMVGVCFQDGDTVSIQYRGTPDSGWVQNTISFTTQIEKALAKDFYTTQIEEEALAKDSVSSKIQADGLKFFDECVEKYSEEIAKGQLIVGGHSQGGNVAEYIMMMSDNGDRISKCVSLDGPGHSDELYKYVVGKYSAEELDSRRSKIISINGNNDFVNMLGDHEFVFASNVYYIATDEAQAAANGKNAFWGWHDLLYMMDGENGGLMSWDAKQGPMGKLMAEINAAIYKLDPEQQADAALSLMALLELTLGSREIIDANSIGVNIKETWQIPFTEEGFGLLSHGLSVIIDVVKMNPDYLMQVLGKLMPEGDREKIYNFFVNESPALGGIAIILALQISYIALDIVDRVSDELKFLDVYITLIDELGNAENIEDIVSAVINSFRNYGIAVIDNVSAMIKRIVDTIVGYRLAIGNALDVIFNKPDTGPPPEPEPGPAPPPEPEWEWETQVKPEPPPEPQRETEQQDNPAENNTSPNYLPGNGGAASPGHKVAVNIDGIKRLKRSYEDMLTEMGKHVGVITEARNEAHTAMREHNQYYVKSAAQDVLDECTKLEADRDLACAGLNKIISGLEKVIYGYPELERRFAQKAFNMGSANSSGSWDRNEIM